MAKTIIGLNDIKAVRKYSGFLAVDTARLSYWQRKMMGRGEDASTPIQMLPHLENDAGDNITYDLSIQLKMQPVEGDDTLDGKEEDLKFYTDQVYIDQMRAGINTGGRMTRKRTLHDLRKVARKRSAEYWGRIFDEIFFMYGSGARGTNAGFTFPKSYNGFANNPFESPDAQHLVYAGSATSKATITAADKFSLNLVDKAKTRATVMGGGTEETPQIQPIMIEGEEHYCIVMHPWQEHDLRTDTGTGGWLDLQKSAAAAEGKNNPIFKGALGMHNGVIMHSHKGTILFDDAGAGSNVGAARALFLGRQAMCCAFGSAGSNLRFDWHEESRDNGNQAVISTSSIFGVKKTRYNGKDFGVVSLDTAAADPTN